MKKNLFVFVVIAFLSGCSVAGSTFSDPAYWIPGDFNPQKGVLLVETFPWSKANENMKNFLAQHYSGKYEVVDRKDIMSKSGKYADTKKYQFAFLWEKNYREKQFAGSSITSASTFTAVDPYGNFYDRSVDKNYPTTKKYNNYGNKSYVPFFNSIEKYFKK